MRPFLVQCAVEHAGEGVEIHRLGVAGDGGVEQRVGIMHAEIEAMLQHAQHLVPLGVAELAIDGDDMDQQGGGGEAIIVLGERSIPMPAGDLGDEIGQGAQHAGLAPRRRRWR